jgi:hypothetical protein
LSEDLRSRFWQKLILQQLTNIPYRPAHEVRRRSRSHRLAGTELPLLLRDANAAIEFLDTTMIHVEAIVAGCCVEAHLDL